METESFVVLLLWMLNAKSHSVKRNVECSRVIKYRMEVLIQGCAPAGNSRRDQVASNKLYLLSKSTAFTHPSFSGLLVICAYLAQTTLPPVVTMPNSETLTSTMVPLVSTPS